MAVMAPPAAAVCAMLVGRATLLWPLFRFQDRHPPRGNTTIEPLKSSLPMDRKLSFRTLPTTASCPSAQVTALDTGFRLQRLAIATTSGATCTATVAWVG